MGGASWIVMGLQAGAVCAIALEGGALVAKRIANSETEAIDGLLGDAHIIIRVGEGAPVTVPCPVLPIAGQCLPVVTQERPADVLGGWVRLWIAGFLARHEAWDGVICVEDGDVTHWVHVSADEIVSFSSFLTLRLIRALGGSETPKPQAIEDSQSRPERLASHLRQAEVVGDLDAITGHLIGAELTAARVYWLGQQLAFIAPGGAGSAHAAALSRQKMPFTAHTPDELIGGGLSELAKHLGLTAKA